MLRYLPSTLSSFSFAEYILEISPFFLGLVLIPVDAHSEFFDGYLKAYLSFLLMFSFFALLRWVVLREMHRSRALKALPKKKSSAPSPGKTRERIIHHILLFGTSILVLASLRPFKDGFPEESFVVALVALAGSALGDSLAMRGHLLSATVARLIYFTGVGFLSIQPSLPDAVWQPALVALGLGCMIAAHSLSKELTKPSGAANLSSILTIRSLRLYSILILSGPLFIAALVYLGQLETIYFLLFTIYPFAYPLLQRLAKTSQLSEMPPLFREQTTGISLLYVVMLVLPITLMW